MKLLKDLIESKTYEGDYLQIIKVIKDFVTENTDGKLIEQKITDKKANLVVCFGNPELIINCHMDTVAPSSLWERSPTQFFEDDENCYGLGSTDTKGNIYMVLKAVEKAKPRNLMLLFSIDEESGSKTGVEYFLETDYKEGLKRAIVCEPTLLQFANKHKGVYTFFVEHRAKSGHSSIKTKSAVVQAAQNIIDLDAEDYNVGKVESLNAGNVVAEYCKFKASIRTYEKYEDIFENIKKISKKGIVISSFRGRPLQNEDPAFKGSFCEVDFWTEAPLFQDVGINTVVFGAGSIKQAHSANEFIAKKQLEDGQNLIEKIIGEEK
ncbi:MAG: M20/M25/M40 family metallo-hydrolase [Clostridia bacterium]|nr:M20/M25/M40 family metallo-hydrolase [Clostridia bacterium]